MAELKVPCFSPRNTDFIHDEAVQRELFARFWALSHDKISSFDLQQLQCFLNFVSTEISNCRPLDHAATMLSDLVAVSDILCENSTLPMTQLMEKVRSSDNSFRNCNDRNIANSIELVVRLCFMINVRNQMPTEIFDLRTALPWPDSSSLEKVMRTWKGQADSFKLQPDYSKFPSLPELERIAGFTIQWTDDLASHLELDNCVLYVFHQVTALKWIQKSRLGALFPDDIIEEYFDTIKLILPITRPECNEWTGRTLRANKHVDPRISIGERLERGPNNFSQWGLRLATIQEAYDRKTPSTFFQFWHDRRDMSKWWGFWMIVVTVFLTILFGLIQSITGMMQVVIALRAS